MPKASLALIQRTIIRDAYEKAGKPYLVNSRPYESTLPIKFDVVAGPTYVAGDGALGTGFLVARAGQTLEFFGYGRSANGGGQVSALNDDTTIVQARHTNASEDFVVEGASLTHRSTRFIFAQTDIATVQGATTDADVLAALGFGATTQPNSAAAFDPSAMYAPLVVQSPVNLEDGLLGAVLPHLNLEFVWGGKRTEPVGCLDNVPEGAAKSLLRSSGLPSTDNRMKIPEGYLWRKSGADEDFIARAILARAIVIPFTNVRFPSVAPGGAGSRPLSVWMDLKLRLHGVAFGFPSRN
jgi:hypothetical protein